MTRAQDDTLRELGIQDSRLQERDAAGMPRRNEAAETEHRQETDEADDDENLDDDDLDDDDFDDDEDEGEGEDEDGELETE
jgi:hypothetical protein